MLDLPCNAFIDARGTRCENMAVARYRTGCVHEHIADVAFCTPHENNLVDKIMHCGRCWRDSGDRHLCLVKGKLYCNCERQGYLCHSMAVQDAEVCDVCRTYGCNAIVLTEEQPDGVHAILDGIEFE